MYSGDMTKEEATLIVEQNFEECRKCKMDYAKLTKLRIINDFLIERFDIDWKGLLRPDEVSK